MIILLYFAGFRENVGADDHSYREVFTQVHNVFNENFLLSYSNYYKEPGFIFLTSLVKTFTDDYHLLFFIVSFFAISINIYYYYKYSPFVILTIALYYVHTFLARDMNQIRAGLACAILLISIQYIKNRNLFKFSIVIIIASLFHVGALVFFVTYFITTTTYSRFTYLITLGMSIALSFLGLSELIVNSLPDSLGIVKNVLVNYYNSPMYKNAIYTFDITNIKQIVIATIFILCLNKLRTKSDFFLILFNIYFIGVLWRLAFSDFGIFAARFATFFTITEVILIPYLLFCFTKRERLIVVFLILFYGFATLYLNIFQKEIKPVYEYKNFIIEELK